jgi:uncharacterized membrane protein YfhO
LNPNDEDFAKFVKRWHEEASPILVLHTPESMQQLNEKEKKASPSRGEITRDSMCTQAAITDISYYPDSLSFSYTGNRDGWLLVTDRWAPGWNVTVNGKSEQSVGGDFVFRAVHVNAGRSRIVYRYSPPWFWPLLILSWIILGAIACGELVRFYFLLYPTDH